MKILQAFGIRLNEVGYRKASRTFIFLVLLGSGFFNIYCTRTKYICAAYQSAFLIDTTARKEMFRVKMGEDSMPLVLDLVKKTDVLLIAPMSKKRKEKTWEIVPMIPVFPPKIELDSAELAAADSLMKAEEEAEDTEEKDEEDDDKLPKSDSTAKKAKPDGNLETP